MNNEKCSNNRCFVHDGESCAAGEMNKEDCEKYQQRMIVGGNYQWKHDPETKLVYLGNNWSGNGYWHQFAKVENPDVVWCEILNAQLPLIEKTLPEAK